jgi:flagellar secretion chaperone FliS
MYKFAAINQYHNVDVDVKVSTSSPHKLISMLLEGAIKKIAIAAGAANRGDIMQRGNNISAAISIVDSLRAALDHKTGGDVARNLEALYYYMERRLTEANRNADTSMMNEVSNLIKEIKSGWDNMSLAAVE